LKVCCFITIDQDTRCDVTLDPFVRWHILGPIIVTEIHNLAMDNDGPIEEFNLIGTIALS